MDYNIEIIRSSRKTVAIEIKKDMRVIVRSPLWMRQCDIQKIINDKSDWIEKHMEIVKQNLAQEEQKEKASPFTFEEINKLADRALEVIPKRLEHFAPIIGVKYGKITIRNQVSRWGSCSSKGNLNFNCLLMLCPAKVLDYVVVHELCHIKQLNHSPLFWAEVARVMPEYSEPKRWLKENGSELIERLR